MKLLIVLTIVALAFCRPQEGDNSEDTIQDQEVGVQSTDTDSGAWLDDVSGNPVVMGTDPVAQWAPGAEDDQVEDDVEEGGNDDQGVDQRNKRGTADNEIFPDFGEKLLMRLAAVRNGDEVRSGGNLQSADCGTGSCAPDSAAPEPPQTTTSRTAQPPPPPPPPVSGFCRAMKRAYDYFCGP